MSGEPSARGADVEVVRGDARLVVAVEGSGPPLLYLHGLTAQAAVAQREAPMGFTLATFDQRGHGAGPRFAEPTAYTIEEFVDDALAVLDALGWDKAGVGGTSMGAAVALRLALDHPGRVEELVLVAPAFSDVPSSEIPTLDAMADVVEQLGSAKGAQALRTAAIEEGRLPERATAFFDLWSAHDGASLAVAMRTVARWVPIPDLDALRRLRMPVAVVAWPDDPLHPLSLAERIVALTGGRLACLSGVAEALESPEAVSRAATALLSGQ